MSGITACGSYSLKNVCMFFFFDKNYFFLPFLLRYNWHVLSHFSHVQLCDPMGCSLPGSSVHGIHQTGTLEWVAMLSSRGSFPTQGSNTCLLHLLHWQVGSLSLVPGKPSACLVEPYYTQQWTFSQSHFWMTKVMVQAELLLRFHLQQAVWSEKGEAQDKSGMNLTVRLIQTFRKIYIS